MGRIADTPDFERAVYRKVTWRLLPLLFLCYILAYIDRVNVGFAKLQMQQDLGMSDAVYGIGAGVFFFGYFLFEVPSNIMLQKVGARRWIAPIMMLWGVVSAATMFATTAASFYALRFLLGILESGFFPGIILYLTFWYPRTHRAKMVAAFMSAIPVSGVIGGPISGWILARMTGVGDLRAWQWLFLLEGLPSVLMGLAALVLLDDGPTTARWLKRGEKDLLLRRLREEEGVKQHHGNGRHSVRDAFRSLDVWLLSLVYFGFVMGNYGVGFWLPQIIKDTLTADPLRIGLISAIPWGVGAISMVIMAHHSDVTGERCWHIVLPGLLGALAFALSGLPLLSGVAGLIALTIATAGVMSAFSIFWSLPTAILSGGAAAAGIAWINSIGNLAGYVSPFAIGAIRDATHSTALALLVLAASSLAASLTVLYLARRTR